MRVYGRLTLGILATIAVFIQWFIQATIIKSLGILLVPMRDEFQVDTWAMGSIIELIECVNDFLAPIAGSIGLVIGHRPAVMTGGIMVSLGFVAASRSSNVLQIALFLNILIGIGYSFPHVLARATLGKHLGNRQFSLASGIGKTGSAFSLFILPPLVQLFLDEFGWRGALLFVGAMSAHLVVCGALLIPSSEHSSDNVRPDYQALPGSKTPSGGCSSSKTGILISLKSICLNVGKAFDPSLMKDCNFWIIVLFFVTGKISKSAWIIYFVPHAVAKGFSNKTGADMVTVAGLGHLVCTILVSVALYREKVTSTSAMMVSVALVAVSLLADPWMNSAWLVSVNAVLFMAAMGSMWALGDVMLKEDLGAEKMVSAYGWIGLFTGMFRPAAGFLPGWIYDQTGSYDLAFVVLGAIQLATLVPLLVKRFKLRQGNIST